MSGKIAQRTIDEVLARASVREVVGRYVALKPAGANFLGLCPFHQEKTPSFNVSEVRGRYRCFGCGASGDALRFLMDYQSLSFAEAVEALAMDVGVVVEREGGDAGPAPSRASREAKVRALEATALAAAYYEERLWSPEGAAARAYVEARGVDEATARIFGLGYAPPRWDGLLAHAKRRGVDERDLELGGLVVRSEEGRVYDRFRERLMFPIRGLRGEVLGFSGRALAPGERAKYINSPEGILYTKGKTLFGLDLAHRAARERGLLVVVEGNFDVVVLRAKGVDHVCAALGTALTEDQARLIKRQGCPVVLLYDGDEAGQRAAEKALGLLLAADVRDVRIARLPEGQDPADLAVARGPEGVSALLDGARPMLDELLETLLERGIRERGWAARRDIVEQALRALVPVRDPVGRSMWHQRLAQRLEVPLRAVQRLDRELRGGKAGGDDAQERPTLRLDPLETALLQLLWDAPELHGVVEREALPQLVEPEALGSFLEEAIEAHRAGAPAPLTVALRTADAVLEREVVRVTGAPRSYDAAALAPSFDEVRAGLKRRWLSKERARLVEEMREATRRGEASQIRDLQDQMRRLQAFARTLEGTLPGA